MYKLRQFCLRILLLISLLSSHIRMVKAEPKVENLLDAGPPAMPGLILPMFPSEVKERELKILTLIEQRRFQEAIPLLEKQLTWAEKNFVPINQNFNYTYDILSLFAVLYERQGAYAKAEFFYLRALEITEKQMWPWDTAETLFNLAGLYEKHGAYSKAEPLYLRAQTIIEGVRGPDDPLTATYLNFTAKFYFSRGDYEKANQLLRRGIAIQSLFLQRRLPLLPQDSRSAQVQTFIDSAWEIVFTRADSSLIAANLALFSRLNRYGLLLEIERRQAQFSRAPGPTRELAIELDNLISQLANVNLSIAERQDLTARKNLLEPQLFYKLPALKPQLIEPAQVARLLPVGAALVEFQRYKPFHGVHKQQERWGASRYLALVITREGVTRAVDLGPASAIDPLIASALKASQASGSDPVTLWKAVNLKIFPASLLQLLAGANKWILDPDGEINRIPFTAIPSPLDSNRLLSDTVSLRLISSARSLVLLSPVRGVTTSKPLVLADPDYGTLSSGGQSWRRLPATSKEGRAIASLINGTLYEQAEATTSRLTSAQAPKIVHVASHGYFAGLLTKPVQMAPLPVGRDEQGRAPFSGLPAAREDVMLNSAIVLAGANRNLKPVRQSTGGGEVDDGYLTAKEVATLQLTGTELVVLSACESAAGEQQSGEGLYGLQRALNVAGARTTLLSLWKVDDDATAYFMERYYKLLKQGKGRMEALLAVQKEFRTNPPVAAWEDFRYWAAWQLVGETGPIEGI